MPLTRKALLIINPGELGDEEYCPGVLKDADRYHNFMMSPVGGVWDGIEIRRLPRPSIREVRSAISECSLADYCLVMFSGHAAYSTIDRQLVLDLGGGQRIASTELQTGGAKQTIILDCCRVVYDVPLLEKKSAIASFSAQTLRETDPRKCRELFSKTVEQAPSSLVTLYSCTPGEYSIDLGGVGGLYNTSLLNAAVSWAADEARKAASTPQAALSVALAHNYAEQQTREKSKGVQNPTIDKPRSGPYFPIAVFA